MAWDELEERKENAFACSVCERVEETPLPRCKACNRRYCEFCVFRVGGGEYCSRECGIRYFFASDEEDEVEE